MPLIQVKLIDEVFTAAQKKEMITRLTDAMTHVPCLRNRKQAVSTRQEI